MTMTYVPSRSTLDHILALSGLVIVVVEIYTLLASPLHVLLLAVGILLIYIGSWRLTGRLLHRRLNTTLREEIDNFIALTRELYSHRTDGDSAAVHETKAALRDSFERILNAASVYSEQPEEQPEG